MSKKVRHIFGLLALVAMLSACSKDAELYTPQNVLQQEKEQIKTAGMPIYSGGTNTDQGNGNGSGGSGVSNSTSNRPTSTSVNDSGKGNISISDDDDDEDDDN